MKLLYEKFVEESLPYLKLCNRFIDDYHLEEDVIIDHVCFKTKTSSEYEQMRAFLELDSLSVFSYQIYLAKRRVAYFRLCCGLSLKTGTIDFIELADKKPEREDRLGFHHVEIYPKRGSYKQLLEKLMSEGVDLVFKERPHHTTHDITLSEGFIIRLTDKPLIQKIAKEQLLQ